MKKFLTANIFIQLSAGFKSRINKASLILHKALQRALSRYVNTVRNQKEALR